MANSFLLEHSQSRLECTQLSNGAWYYSPVEQQYDSFVELGVVCINYEEFYHRSRDRTLSTHFLLVQKVYLLMHTEAAIT